MIGTDYGHKDSATDIRAMRRLGDEGNLGPDSVHKILDTNPSTLYGLN